MVYQDRTKRQSTRVTFESSFCLHSDHTTEIIEIYSHGTFLGQKIVIGIRKKCVIACQI